MSVPAPQPEHDTLHRLQDRLRTINSMLAWQERTRAALAAAEAENAGLRADLTAAYHLIQSYQFALGLDPAEAPPAELVIAWHTGSQTYTPVPVDVDGVEWIVVVDSAPRIPNPVQEWHDWQQLKAIFRKVNEQVEHIKQLEGETEYDPDRRV
ncbi:MULTISPECIES: hypothetical protein [unclassified Nonomuraea]|uniref:hypothetical protein n=1 Tax=unclassified Nonomuraea TaxID=2593643 RepID=UPI0033C644F0